MLLERREILAAAGSAAAALFTVEVVRPTTVEAQAFPEMPNVKEDAARLYGADDYSRNPDNWSIYKLANGEVTGATLRANPDSTHTRVNVSGAALEAYLEIQDKGEVAAFPHGKRPMVFVVDGRTVPQFDIRGGTFWTASQIPTDLFVDMVYNNLVERECREQPGAIVTRVTQGASQADCC